MIVSEMPPATLPSLDLTERPCNPTQLQRPAFLMNFPFSLSTEVPNNSWMEDLRPAEREIDFERAMAQFFELYGYLASEALIYLLPTPRRCGLQDLVYTGNLGVVLDHVPAKDTVVLSNFSSQPRRGETDVGRRFFDEMGYRAYVPPTRFEGEAELKHLHDNIYVGGYGIRSEYESYEWMERRFDMQVVKVRLTDPYLYHLDCTVFPVTREQTLVCTELYEPEELAAIETETEIVDVSIDDCYCGITNCVRLSNVVLNASRVHDLAAGTQEYRDELHKNRRLEEIASELACEVAYFNLSEYEKSGALLSCMILHLNRSSYGVRLL